MVGTSFCILGTLGRLSSLISIDLIRFIVILSTNSVMLLGIDFVQFNSCFLKELKTTGYFIMEINPFFCRSTFMMGFRGLLQFFMFL